ncbi:hypothetical protein P175DRAFT_0164387 [Aspergillus ochraceoroseus IBT 24754]|uniref:Uncharacterized protein n=1 Tax=Aspergillus ochraceoroseus IBT 24754 TaxID=1392256 RepID=A0A2T5M3W5_9EURO|nr:uncharacterized protein P175DRAFT_0164387 [Aspergillus ochraceoroseus IBT 24754]PTU23230.1 hypothetical protein P175DRAFT_0164387 [Aspergillus ochraceoroseus IBT 24754]
MPIMRRETAKKEAKKQPCDWSMSHPRNILSQYEGNLPRLFRGLRTLSASVMLTSCTKISLCSWVEDACHTHSPQAGQGMNVSLTVISRSSSPQVGRLLLKSFNTMLSLIRFLQPSIPSPARTRSKVCSELRNLWVESILDLHRATTWVTVICTNTLVSTLGTVLLLFPPWMFLPWAL